MGMTANILVVVKVLCEVYQAQLQLMKLWTHSPPDSGSLLNIN